MTNDAQTYFCFDGTTNPTVATYFSETIARLHAGELTDADVDHDGYEPLIKHNGHLLLASAIPEFQLRTASLDSFDSNEHWQIIENLRQLVGWENIGYSVEYWLKEALVERYFDVPDNPYSMTRRQLKPDVDLTTIPPQLLEFACKVAVALIRYGQSYQRSSAEEIFTQITILGSDLPERLVGYGSGQLPEELALASGSGWSARANDVSGIITVTMTEEAEQPYREVLTYLIKVVSSSLFPASYGIVFTGPTENFLPIPHLTQHGINQLFQCAARYPALLPIIADYADAAMNEYHWYLNLEDEDCAMPGTFAVFALGLYDDTAAPIVLKYLKLCDGEHQSVHGLFVAAAIEKFGFTATTIDYLLCCVNNSQDPPELTKLTTQKPGREALAILEQVKTRTDEYEWDHIQWSIWGEEPETEIANAPAELQPQLRDLLS
ncbi:hypothetical protein CMUST_03080 [Corynebacterium mustelae]|uniref:Uncharacterized protein n=1 Tax=Corynebacterium mustelae TaxID=571915 RepID=A0A0G3GWQ1_9CORY|nr:DUF6138 family protein [Corynebacterium mustelae]AKK04960.1 hypothetical protein CMUST_03080 [Corynebacterium mustelae]